MPMKAREENREIRLKGNKSILKRQVWAIKLPMTTLIISNQQDPIVLVAQ